MVDGCEPVKLELCNLGSEPISESDFVVVEIGSLEDIKDPLTLLCMRRQVVNVTGNRGLNPTISGHIYYPPAHAEERQKIADILERPFLPNDEVALLERFRAQNTQLELEHLTTVHHRVLYDLYFKFPLIPTEPNYVPLPSAVFPP
ncbi:hypothetical protein SCLCIDRAFT_30920 [Scleroderma citrinum Foug A]|uniref:Uncharacterized protein n=1 Tax=Scleroderma citrinum Foug A TaxID=1036808 RepID=A0A0C3D1J1_9AGAM|nr:hypothetical protein SCLCIDRAFT_30920 [Scleroderma citrinum Foug A]